LRVNLSIHEPIEINNDFLALEIRVLKILNNEESMMKQLISTLSAVALALSLSSVMAATGNGKALGHNKSPELASLEATKCSNAGKGNGAESYSEGEGCDKGLPLGEEENDTDPGNSANTPAFDNDLLEEDDGGVGE